MTEAISNLSHKHKKTTTCAEVNRRLENVSFTEKQSFEHVILIFNGCMNEQNSSFCGPKKNESTRLRTPTLCVNTENGTYLVRMPCSVSVCHPGVCWLCRLPGCGVCACVCDWWVWERVQEYSVTQESNVAACGFLTGSIVVEGDMFSWGKARPVLSPPPTPQTLHPHTRPWGPF